MNKKQVLTILKTVGEFYNQKPLTEHETLNKVNLWHEILKEYEFDIVYENLKSHIKTSKYPPVIADLITQTEERERFIPTAEDTKRLLDEYEQKQKEVAADPKTQEERAKAREKINKMFGRVKE
jgi:hypothetical protein